jgi:hypothetical protein
LDPLCCNNFYPPWSSCVSALLVTARDAVTAGLGSEGLKGRWQIQPTVEQPWSSQPCRWVFHGRRSRENLCLVKAFQSCPAFNVLPLASMQASGKENKVPCPVQTTPGQPSSSTGVTPSRLDRINQLKDELTCSICLDVCTRPVTTPCGKSLDAWGRDDGNLQATVMLQFARHAARHFAILCCPCHCRPQFLQGMSP